MGRSRRWPWGRHYRRGKNSALSGGDGNDRLGVSWGSSNSTLYGGFGNDDIQASGSSRGYGGVGDDTLYGSDASTLYGGAGDDVLTSSKYNEGDGQPIAFGEEGNDTLIINSGLGDGGAGDDVLSTVRREVLDPEIQVTLTGGDGEETFILSPGLMSESVGDEAPASPLVTVTDFDPLTEQLIIHEDKRYALMSIDFETARDGSYTDIIAHYEVNESAGAGSEDVQTPVVYRLEGVSSLSEDNISVISGSDDTLMSSRSGTDGDDTLNAQSQNLLLAGDGNDQVIASSDNSAVHLGDGEDTIVAEGDSANVYGGAGNDSLSLSGDSSYAYGGNGDDTITVGGTGVTADGGTGNDTFVSERGAGSNEFRGGAGFDTYDIGLGDTVFDRGQGDYTLNVYPEELGEGPAHIRGSHPPEANITLNLPAEVTGDLSIRSTFGEQDQEPYQIVTLTTTDGQELLTIRISPEEVASLDLFTINRDVVF